MDKNEEKLERQITQLSEQNDKLQTTLLESVKARVIAPDQLVEKLPTPPENKG